jgi:hypothetical protein
MKILSGHCLCGGVTYSSNAEPVLTAICHCSHCQKQTGAPFSCSVAVPEASLKIAGPTLKTYNDVGGSGAPVQRKFCGNCGAQILSHTDAAPGLVFIKVGTLTDTSWINPSLEIWHENAQAWLKGDSRRHLVDRNGPPGA